MLIAADYEAKSSQYFSPKNSNNVYRKVYISRSRLPKEKRLFMEEPILESILSKQGNKYLFCSSVSQQQTNYAKEGNPTVRSTSHQQTKNKQRTTKEGHPFDHL